MLEKVKEALATLEATLGEITERARKTMRKPPSLSLPATLEALGMETSLITYDEVIGAIEGIRGDVTRCINSTPEDYTFRCYLHSPFIGGLETLLQSFTDGHFFSISGCKE